MRYQINAGCSCGATINVGGEYMPSIALEVAAWRRDHPHPATPEPLYAELAQTAPSDEIDYVAWHAQQIADSYVRGYQDGLRANQPITWTSGGVNGASEPPDARFGPEWTTGPEHDPPEADEPAPADELEPFPTTPGMVPSIVPNTYTPAPQPGLIVTNADVDGFVDAFRQERPDPPSTEHRRDSAYFVRTGDLACRCGLRFDLETDLDRHIAEGNYNDA